MHLTDEQKCLRTEQNELMTMMIAYRASTVSPSWLSQSFHLSVCLSVCLSELYLSNGIGAFKWIPRNSLMVSQELSWCFWLFSSFQRSCYRNNLYKLCKYGHLQQENTKWVFEEQLFNLDNQLRQELLSPKFQLLQLELLHFVRNCQK